MTAVTLIENHMEISRRFILQADGELRDGDVLQASEKAWGAAVHSLKAIARLRRWDHGGHYQLAQTAKRLADETGQPDIRRLFSVAESLHANFYNAWKPEDTVREDIEDVKILLAMLWEIAAGLLE